MFTIFNIVSLNDISKTFSNKKEYEDNVVKKMEIKRLVQDF